MLKSRNHGAYLLARLGKTQGKIAEEMAVNPGTVSQWASGGKVPGQDNRAKLKQLYLIPEDAWDDESFTPPANPEGDNAEGKDFSSRIRTELEKSLNDLESDKKMPPKARADLLAKLAHAAVEIEKAEDKGDITTHPDWERVEETIRTILSAHPEALASWQTIFPAPL